MLWVALLEHIVYVTNDTFLYLSKELGNMDLTVVKVFLSNMPTCL